MKQLPEISMDLELKSCAIVRLKSTTTFLNPLSSSPTTAELQKTDRSVVSNWTLRNEAKCEISAQVGASTGQ